MHKNLMSIMIITLSTTLLLGTKLRSIDVIDDSSHGCCWGRCYEITHESHSSVCRSDAYQRRMVLCTAIRSS
ncbi:hypothetical protein EMIT0194MI4_10248 [Pseudomonas sp. IT-194MI4]